METQTKGQLSRGKKVLYGVLIYLGVVVLFVLILVAAGKYTAQKQTRQDASTLPDLSSLQAGEASGTLVPDYAPSIGPKDARVTIVEFGDFQCPFCQESAEPVRRIQQQYASEVRLVFRHFPLTPIHPLAQILAHASMCANQQGKFWPFYDRLYAHQDTVTEDNLPDQARAVGLDVGLFQACQTSGRFDDQINQDLAEIVSRGGQGTPSWIVNGQLLQGYISYATWQNILSQLLGT